MNKIMETSQNKDKILQAETDVYCSCGEKQFSPFDKLYVSTYGKCIMCSSEEEIDKNSPNIFNIL